MAHELLIPDIGDMAFQLLGQTSLFKDSKEDKVPRITRNYKIFPRYTDAKITEYTPSRIQEKRNSPVSDHSSVSSLSTSTINESSIKLLGLLKKSNLEKQEKIPNPISVDPEIHIYVQQTIQRKLDQFLKTINSSILTEDVNILSNDGEIRGVFRGRGPKRTRKRKPVIQSSNTIDLRPTLFLNNMFGSEILNAVHDAPVKEDVNREGSPSALNVSTSSQSSSSTQCGHYIQWSNTCLETNCEDKASSNSVQTQNKSLLCNECLNSITQMPYCGHFMCGKSCVVCASYKVFSSAKIYAYLKHPFDSQNILISAPIKRIIKHTVLDRI